MQFSENDGDIYRCVYNMPTIYILHVFLYCFCFIIFSLEYQLEVWVLTQHELEFLGLQVINPSQVLCLIIIHLSTGAWAKELSDQLKAIDVINYTVANYHHATLHLTY